MTIVSRWVTGRKQFPQDRVSYSILKEMDKCPAEAIYKKHNKTAPTPAMEFGSAVEDILFGPEEPRVKEHNNPMKSKLTKEFKEAGGEMTEHASAARLLSCEAA